jgi:hypothetical protein
MVVYGSGAGCLVTMANNAQWGVSHFVCLMCCKAQWVFNIMQMEPCVIDYT